jgi:prepilin signal peptidase PulO-like enzyme (type II secretory pathway)
MIVWFLCILLGLSFGSFLSVCVERLPNGESLILRSSHCARCQTKLHWIELIPLVSFIRQKGRCATCHQSISVIYPLLELASACVVTWSVLELGVGLEALRIVMLLLLLLAIAVVDARHFLIPDVLLVFGAASSITLQAFLHPTHIIESLGNGLASFAMIFLVYLAGNFLFKKKTMGLGDIKLSGLLGLILGVKLFLFSFWIACVLGALYGLTNMLASNATRDTKIPFGTMLSIASGLLIIFPDSFTYYLDAWLNTI